MIMSPRCQHDFNVMHQIWNTAPPRYALQTLKFKAFRRVVPDAVRRQVTHTNPITAREVKPAVYLAPPGTADVWADGPHPTPRTDRP